MALTTLVMAGDADPQVVVGGESHRTALLYALEEFPREDMRRAVFISQRISGEAEPGPGWEGYWPEYVSQMAGRSAVIVWSGNQHVTYFLFETDMEVSLRGPFPYRPSEPAGSFVTERALRALLAPSVEPMCEVIPALLSTAKDVLVIGTPPPTAAEVTRERFIAKKAQNTKLQRGGVDITTAPMQPDSQRVALWSLVQDVTRETAEAQGARWVPVPPSTFDSRGLLHPQYARDGSHGNAEFGAIMWDEIAQALRGSQT